LGIAALEDKIVQQAMVTVLSHIYEEDFLGFSCGFRPGKSRHDALDSLWIALMGKKVTRCASPKGGCNDGIIT
jgi:retron-type reverse transcriptase